MNHHDILSKMTLEEKCLLLAGKNAFQTYEFPHHSIPSLWCADGPHGLRKQLGQTDHLGLNGSEPATCFPTAATLANSWDPALCQQVGRALAEEAAAQQVNVVLGPGLNIKRSPLCGRNFEYYSEDPYLSGKLAAASIRGIQENGTAACPKHFAANSQELRRMASDSIVDERTLREIYLTGFEIAVTEGKPKAIMSSYNAVNGVYANENPHLMQEILRQEWGFDGAVITDWGGCNDHVEGVKNGSSLQMPGPGLTAARELLEAVEQGRLTVEQINARAGEVLDLVFSTRQESAQPFDKNAHHAIACRAAAESIVLLKNEGAILPLQEGEKVAVIGDFAQTPRYQGAGSSAVNPLLLDQFWQQCQRLSGWQLQGCCPGFLRSGKPEQGLLREAVELAKRADTVLLFAGLPEIAETEGVDRSTMALSENQAALIRAVKQVNSRVILVLSGGSPMEFSEAELCPAIVHGYLGGQGGATAMVEVLTGRVNPSGKIAETWPLSYGDCPVSGNYPGRQREVEYREGPFVGYRYYDTVGARVRWPFGHGLSYTTFAYSDLQVYPDKVAFTLTNTGKLPGSEVYQLYISLKDSRLVRPVKELKGFGKRLLLPGESQTVTLPLDKYAFRYYNRITNSWQVEAGAYTLSIGASSRDIRLEGQLVLQGTQAPVPEKKELLPNYRTGNVKAVSREEFENLLGHPVTRQTRRIHANSAIRDLSKGFSPVGWLVCGVLKGLRSHSRRTGVPNLNLEFIYNEPLRGLSKFLSGCMDRKVINGLVMELRGFWIFGLLRALWAMAACVLANRRLAGILQKQAKEGCK